MTRNVLVGLVSGVIGMVLGSQLVVVFFWRKPVECPPPAIAPMPTIGTLQDEHWDRQVKNLQQQLDSHEKRLNVQSEMLGDLIQRASLHHHDKNGVAIGPFENPPHQPEPQ